MNDKKIKREYRVHMSQFLKWQHFYPGDSIEACRLFLGVSKWAKKSYRDPISDYIIFTD